MKRTIQENLLMAITEAECQLATLKDIYIESLEITSVDQIRALDPKFHNSGLMVLLGTLDNTLETEDDDPEAFCVDYWRDAIDDPDVAAGVIDDHAVQSARDIIAWIDAREERLKAAAPAGTIQ